MDTQQNRAISQHYQNLDEYEAGQTDRRPWGEYKVINVGMHKGEEFCEKNITINPRQALSLQRHKFRREVWKVLQGQLTVILDSEIHVLNEGDGILIPLSAVHCMINMTDEPVMVYEKQVGVCREEDNDRLCDLSGRKVEFIHPEDKATLHAVDVYKDVTKSLA